MPVDLNRLQNTLAAMRTQYERAIKVGRSGAVIRSGGIIRKLHEFAIGELHATGVKPDYIHPETTLAGHFKPKSQDILIARTLGEPLISVNVRSQLSSIQKNYDTLYERLIAEAVNLHERYPALVCGYIYLLPTVGYDSDAMKDRRIAHTEKFNWEKYLHTFSLLQNRITANDKPYKYESLCLLAVDFGTHQPKVLHHVDEFVELGLISADFGKQFSYNNLAVSAFVDTLLLRFRERSNLSLQL